MPRLPNPKEKLKKRLCSLLLLLLLYLALTVLALLTALVWLDSCASVVEKADMYTDVYSDVMTWLCGGSPICGKTNWLLDSL